MSLRWHIRGIDLTGLDTRLGSRDESLLARLQTMLDGRIERALADGLLDSAEDARQHRSAAHQILTRAIREGVPFDELDGEESVHVDVADAVATDGQTSVDTDSWDWKHGAWFDFEERISPLLSQEGQRLLALLVHGRPLFGRRFDTGWEFYTYLRRDEVSSLRAAIAAVIAAIPPDENASKRSFDRELVGWLDAVSEAGLDLWSRAE